MKRMHLVIDKMHCSGCVNTVRDALQKIDGITIKLVQVGTVVVDYDDTKLYPEDIFEALEQVGYSAREL